MLQQISFHGLESGPHLVVFGAVHGNEKCGTAAIRQAVHKLESGELQLVRGRVTFVPVANPRAYEQDVRFIDRNLNRHFYPKTTRNAYEDYLDPILCAILDSADALLDLHSYQSEGGAFCFLGTTSQKEIEYSRALGVDTFIYGWADAFSRNATEEQRRASIGTTDYTRMNGRDAVAVTVECGQHQHPDNLRVGYEAIVRALGFFGMIASPLAPKDQRNQQCIRMQSVYYKEREGIFAQPWKHADKVVKGQLIARYIDGTEITAPEDGIIVLPKTRTDHTIGAEWFYFGAATEFPEIYSNFTL